MSAVLPDLPTVLYGLLVILAAQLPELPAMGAHRHGAPARPAPARGRHEGPVKPGWPELQLVAVPARHESGAYPVLEVAA